MAVDVVSGALFFATFSILCYTLSAALPLWWFTTVELEGQMCTCGAGLWKENFTWGDDITQPNLLARPVECIADNAFVTEGCGTPYEDRHETEWKGLVGGVFSIISVLFASGSVGFGLSVTRGRVKPQSSDLERFRKMLVWGCVCSVIAMISQIITLGVFMSAPLFHDLSYRFGCHFVFNHPLNSNVLKCHALGPSFGLSVGGCIMCVFACVCFYIAYKNPHYIDPSTARYSMFQAAMLGARPLDPSESELQPQSSEYVPLSGDESYNIYDEITFPKNKETLSFFCAKMTQLYYIPILLILNAALFVWSNCSTGATVEPNVVIQFPQHLHWIVHKILPDQVDKNGVLAFKDDVFNFTLVTSLRHFWEGKAYALAFLIGIFSGMWPYVKIFTMLFLWFIPARESLRSKLLHWLDVLGKLSLIDAYVLCLMAVAFGFTTDKNILGIEIHVDISVRPGWGVYSFVIATMWSLLMSHHLTRIHERAMDKREQSQEMIKAMDLPIFESLSYRSYAPFPKHRRFGCTRFGRILVWLVLALSFLVILTGQLIRTFEFRFSGLADLILPPEKRDNPYSLLDNGVLLPDAASKGGFLSGGNWAWFITIMYFAFAMVVPLLQILLLAVLWSVPMKLSSFRNVFNFTKFLSAWAALDVFLVSVIAAVVEIGGLSESIIGDAFGSIQDTLCKLLHELPPNILDDILHAIGLPSIGPELDNCALFRVEAVLLEGCWMLLAGVLASIIANHLIMEFAEASMQERLLMAKVFSKKQNVIDSDEDSPDPYIRIREASVSESVPRDAMSPRFVRTGSFNNVSSARKLASLKKIIEAQEEGARRFMGSYFGGSMYGPFHREAWRYLCHLKVVYKVDWNETGFEVHAALLMNQLLHEEEEEDAQM